MIKEMERDNSPMGLNVVEEGSGEEEGRGGGTYWSMIPVQSH